MLLFVGAAGLLLSSACLLSYLSLPDVENHPQPTLALSGGDIEAAGCPPNEYGFRECPEGSPLRQLGCEQIQEPGDLLGGLQPAHPIYVCRMRGESSQPLEPGEFLYDEGCLSPMYVRYVFRRDSQFQLIKSLGDLQQVYAPIESQNEALSYAVAATGLGARYGLEAERGLRYFVDQLEDTHVDVTSEGYLVHLYDYKLCGCGPHTTYAVEILVTQDGQVQEISRQPAYEDPEEDGLCVD